MHLFLMYYGQYRHWSAKLNQHLRGRTKFIDLWSMKLNVPPNDVTCKKRCLILAAVLQDSMLAI